MNAKYAYDTRQAEETLQRSHEALEAAPGLYAAPRLLEDIARRLSRLGQAAAQAELLNASLQRTAELAYEVEGGRLVNVDIVDGRLLFPAPFGRAGHRLWQLRRRESDVLRAALVARMQPKAGQPVPLFIYGDDTRRWHVNFTDYPTMDAAMRYLRGAGALTAKEYAQRLNSLQKVDRKNPAVSQVIAKG